MKDIIVYVLGEHSDSAQSQVINRDGYTSWWSKHVTPGIAAARRLGYRPIVVHRFPGATFGSYRVTLSDFLNVAGSDWAATVKRQTMPAYRWPWQKPLPPVEYRAYLPDPDLENGDLGWSLGLLALAECGAYFEGVTDTVARGFTRERIYSRSKFFGNEPVPDRAHPIAARDPFIVAEDMLDAEGRDFRGKNWNPSWIPLAEGQQRALILHDAPTTLAQILEREAAGWVCAVYSHRLAEVVG